VTTSRALRAAVGALVIAVSVAACGSDSNPSSGANTGAATGAGQSGNARRGFLQDPKVVACLKKQGVTVPSGPRRGNGGQGQNGQPPTGTNRRPPAGQGGPNGPGSAQFQKLRAAMQKCGVDFGGRPPNGQPPQGGQGTTGTTTSAS
jgi:hypothetical protein